MKLLDLLTSVLILTLILMAFTCRDYSVNDNVQSYPDFGQNFIENNVWYKWYPLRYNDPVRFYHTLEIDRETWTVKVLDMEVGGQVTWNKDHIIFHNTVGDVIKECNRNGVYAFIIQLDRDQDQVLNLLMEEDVCPRAGYLMGWWWKVDTND